MIWYALLGESVALNDSLLAHNILEEFRIKRDCIIVRSIEAFSREASENTGLILFSLSDLDYVDLFEKFSTVLYVDIAISASTSINVSRVHIAAPIGVSLVGILNESDITRLLGKCLRISHFSKDIYLSTSATKEVFRSIELMVEEVESFSASGSGNSRLLEEKVAQLEQSLSEERARVAAWEREQGRLSFKIMSRVRQFMHTYFSGAMKFLHKLVLICNSYGFSHPKFFIRMPYQGSTWVSDQPIVSVVIPCYNYGRFIEQALESVLRQTFTDFEIHIVDGGSTDENTIDVLNSIKHPKVKVHMRQGRHLVGDNRNFGVMQSSSKYVCCLDADDLLEPTYLETAIFLLESQRLDIVSCSTESFGTKSGVWLLPRRPLLSHIKRVNTFSTVAIFSRDLWARAGGFHDFGLGKDHIHEDWCLWQRFLALGGRGKNITTPLLKYRIHSTTSLSQQAGVVPGLKQQRASILRHNSSLMSPWVSFRSFLARFVEYRNLSLNIKNDKDRHIDVLVISDASLLDIDERLSSMLRQRAKDEQFYLVSLKGNARTNFFSRHFCLREFLEPKDFKYFFDYLKSSRKAFFYSWDVGESCFGIEMKSVEDSKKEKKIVLSVPWLDFGGSSVLLNMVFTDLKNSGYSITVVASNPAQKDASGKGVELYKGFSSDLVDIPYENKFKDQVIESVAVSRQADILMIVGCEATYSSLPHIKNRMPHLKVVDHLYNPYGHISNNKKYRKYIDFNIAANEEVRSALLRNGFQGQMISVIHHGIKIAEFFEKVPRDTGSVTFGFLGRFSPEKRPADVIELAKRMATEKFVMAGDGELLLECRSLVSKYGLSNCMIMGFAEDKAEFWRSIDVLVLTSEVEGLPLVILEAMSQSIPVIASEVGHIPYLIESGVDGFTFPAKDIDGLVDRAYRYLSLNQSQREELGMLAREKILREYSSEVCSKKYDDVFRTL